MTSKTFKSLKLAIAVVMACAAVGAKAVDTHLGDRFININAGVAGDFQLSYPVLLTGSGEQKAISVALGNQNKQATLSYAGGAAVVIDQNGSDLRIQFSNLPKDAQSFRVAMELPIIFSTGGQYVINDKPAKAFPATKPPKPFLYQGQAATIGLIHPSGVRFNIQTPASWSFNQIQDNREWHSANFGWMAVTDLPKGQPTASFSMAVRGDGEAAPKAHILIDRYGQYASAKFPEKVTSDNELKADAIADEAYYGGMKPPGCDAWGGLPGSGEKFGLKATGFFHVGQAGKSQVLVTPDGNAFFQLGMCGLIRLDDFTLVKGRESIYESLPSPQGEFATAFYPQKGSGVLSFYQLNLIRKYGKPYDSDEYTARWIDRLHQLGFNSEGAWSFGEGPVPAEKKFASTPFLPLGDLKSIGGGSHIWDPFADDVEQKIDAAFAKNLPKSADNPMIIGYFADNEPPLEDVTRLVPTLKASKSASKRTLIDMLQKKYSTIDAFNQSWGTKADSFDQLGDQPLSVKTADATADMQAFLASFLDRRYSLEAAAFHKYDKNHLLIGDRLTPGTANNRLVAEACGKYVDVVSVNYYTYAIEADFLQRISKWAGNKPLLLSEFHFTTTDQGFASGGSVVSNQAERGEAYRSYVENAAATGLVVGIQWFEGLDQAPTGRWFQGFNGESANTGLVNVADRPYKDFLAGVSAANYELYDVMLNGKKVFVPTSPRFQVGAAKDQVAVVPSITKPFQDDAGHNEFPGTAPVRVGGDRMVLGAASGTFEATYRTAWDAQNFYLYVDIVDPTPMKSTTAAQDIWSADGVELFFGSEALDEGGPPKYSDRHVLLRGAASTGKGDTFVEGALEQPAIKTIVVPSSDGRGYTLKAAIPFSVLGITPAAGNKVKFDIAFNDSGDGVHRDRQLVWNGTARNSKDRSGWGRAQFVP